MRVLVPDAVVLKVPSKPETMVPVEVPPLFTEKPVGKIMAIFPLFGMVFWMVKFTVGLATAEAVAVSSETEVVERAPTGMTEVEAAESVPHPMAFFARTVKV
jgi:hypothetical protein